MHSIPYFIDRLVKKLLLSITSTRLESTYTFLFIVIDISDHAIGQLVDF